MLQITTWVQGLHLLAHFPDKKQGEDTPPAESSPFQRIPGRPTMTCSHFIGQPQPQGRLGNIVFQWGILLP